MTLSKPMPPEETKQELSDVKDQEVDSSTTQTDVNQNKEADPSAAEKEGVKEEPQTTDEIVDAIKDKYKEDKASSPDGEVKLDNLNSPEGEAEVAKEEATEAKKTEEAVPYQRFKEVNEKATALEEPATRMRQVEAYCSARGLDGADFQAGLDIMAAIKNDPKKAREMLLPIMEQLSIQTGDGLPKDLRQGVEDGVITPEHAKELAQLRLRSQNLERQGKFSQEQQAARHHASLVQGLESWDVSKRKMDLTFKPKTNGEPDGLYEQFEAKLAYLLRTNQVNTVQDAVRLAEQAYESVTAYTKRLLPQAQPKKVLRSSGSSTTAKETIDTSKPGWAHRVKDQIAARY